jgi:hypothetical protein
MPLRFSFANRGNARTRIIAMGRLLRVDVQPNRSPIQIAVHHLLHKFVPTLSITSRFTRISAPSPAVTLFVRARIPSSSITMATIKQIEANRLNPQKSTGPRSAEGKAVTSMNALKSGIDAQSHIIRGEDHAQLQTLAAEYLERFRPATPEERSYQRALRELEHLQSTPQPVARPDLPETLIPPQPAETSASSPAIGFVPQPSLPPASLASRPPGERLTSIV